MSEPTSPDCCACGCVNETRESRKSEWIYWTCGGWQHIDSGKFGVSGIENRGTHMALIRSLREELAEAHRTIGSLIAAHYDTLPHISGIRPFEQVMNEYANNEHRSDT